MNRATWFFIVLSVSCTGRINGSVTGGGTGGGTDEECPPLPGSNSETERIRQGLAPTCAGCHGTGDTGYFASRNAFESLLVRNPRLVSPGQPDESDLVKLLEGRRSGSSQKQMPISGDPFIKLDTDGKTSIHLDEVRAWITSLQVPGVAGDADPTVSAANRIDATFVEFGLRDLLGLTEDDFYTAAYSYGVLARYERSDDFYDLRSPDRAPGQWAPKGRFTSLGGAAASISAHVDPSISTNFVQTLTPLSQAWCGMAVRKAGNKALFTTGSAMTGGKDLPTLRAQMADWHALFLSETPTEADLDDEVNGVFLPLEAKSGTQVAWVGTCSYFVRHPLFVFY